MKVNCCRDTWSRWRIKLKLVKGRGWGRMVEIVVTLAIITNVSIALARRSSDGSSDLYSRNASWKKPQVFPSTADIYSSSKSPGRDETRMGEFEQTQKEVWKNKGGETGSWGSSANIKSSSVKSRKKSSEGDGREDGKVTRLDFPVSDALGASRGSRTSGSSETNSRLHQRIRDLLTTSPLIDGHNDLPWNIRKYIHNQIGDFHFSHNLRHRSVYPWSNSTWSHTDIPRLRKGLVGAQLWVAYVPCEAQKLNGVQITLEQIDLIRRLIGKYPDDLKLALSADDILKAHEEGKIASLIAVEGGHSIGNSLSTLRAFYELGVRSMTLTHSCNTPWADSSIVEKEGHKPEHGGLTGFGRTVVKEMNRLGMLIDLSHTSKMTMKDALNESQAPVIFSHSSAHALCNSSRNVPDDILKELVWNRGIVMVTFYNYFVKCQENATVRDVADHINYIRDTIGVNHIGIGAGFDGINRTPKGLEDSSKYPNLFVELAKHSRWTDDDLKRVAGLNFLNVFREAEHIRDKMKKEAVEAYNEPIPFRYIQNQLRCSFNITSMPTVSQ